MAVMALFAAPAFSEEETKPVEAPKPGRVNWAQIEVTGAYPEGAQLPSLFGSAAEGLSDGLSRLTTAASDDSIKGVILKIDGPTIGWAKLNEFRAAIDRVKAKGKRVVAALDSAASMDYLLACSCDEIVMPESGVLMLLGLRAEVSFYKNLFDKLDLKAEMLRVGEYKSAAEPYTRTQMSDEFREEMETVLDDYYRQMVDLIATGRKLDREKVIAAIDAGPHTAAKAKELGLLDRVAYSDELQHIARNGNAAIDLRITERYGKKKADTDFSGMAGMMKMMNLLMGLESPERKTLRPKIAVIHATGTIMPGRSGSSLFGGQTLGSDTFIKAVKRATDDTTVKAVVLRVDSPGGSALASDLMWRALEQMNKPFVVSMGDTAASGGYYISMGADRIFAEPGTLTGSIGVVGGKVALNGLFEKVGITTSVITRGKNTGAMSMLSGFTDSERESMQKILNDIYEQFTRKAAEGRKMEYDKLEKMARGRVYTGAMAKELGLVDELGTLEDAIAYATKVSGLEGNDRVERLILPRPASPLEALLGPIDTDASLTNASSAALKSVIDSLSPEIAEHLKAADLINVLAREPRLLVMPFRLIVK